MNIIDRMKSLNTRDLLIVVVGAGAIAGVSGVATLLTVKCSHILWDSNLPFLAKTAQSAALLVGGIMSIPFILAKQSGPSALGFPNQVKYNMNNDKERIKDYAKSRFSNLPPAPDNYVYTTDEVGRQLLILDPATGF